MGNRFGEMVQGGTEETDKKPTLAYLKIRKYLSERPESVLDYLIDPCKWEALLGGPQRGVARGEGLGQNPRSRRPAPV